MKKKKVALITMALGVLVLLLPVAQGWAVQHMQMHQTPKTAAITLDQLYAKQLPLLSQTLANARKAVEMGHKEHALAELHKIEDLLAQVTQTLGEHVKPVFANTTCPIMGSRINPAKVTADLVRDYQGQKVAFCCAGCPSAWDKLSARQKQAKLQKAGAKPTSGHQGHSH